jgi:hypothetical protein
VKAVKQKLFDLNQPMFETEGCESAAEELDRDGKPFWFDNTQS